MEEYIENFYEGTLFEKGYGKVARKVMRDPNLSRDAKALYAYLMSLAGTKMEAFPGWKTICDELGFRTKDTYYKYMNELKSYGLLKVTQHKEKGKWSKNIYTLALRNEQVEEFKAIPKKQETEKKGIGKNSNRYDSESNINNSLNIINKEEEETIKPIINLYHDCKGKAVSPTEKKALFKLYTQFSLEIVNRAIEIMSEKAEKPSISYLKSTLNDWDSKGLNTLKKVNISIAEYEENNKKLREDKRKSLKSIIQKSTKDNFNNYQQRDPDEIIEGMNMNELEKKLNGW